MSLNSLQTGNARNAFVYVNNDGVIEYRDMNIIPPDIQPGSADTLFTTNASGSTQWQKLQNAQVADDTLTGSKIISIPTTKLTGTITNAQLAGSITSDKIVSIPFSKITDTNNVITNDMLTDNCVNTSEITNDAVTTLKIINSAITTAKIADSQITQEKMLYDAPARQRYTDFVTGQDAVGWGYSADKPFKTLQYAVDSISQNGFVINVLQSEDVGTLTINNKLQLVIKGWSSGVSNSPNLVIEGSIVISGNSSSIKITNLQIDARGKNVHALICQSPNNYFRDLTILGDVGKGAYIHAASLYNQFQTCDVPLYFESATPSSTNLTLCFNGCNIANSVVISNSYILAIDNCAMQGITQSAGSLQIFNSQVQADVTFSSAFPNVMAIVGCRLFDQTFTAKRIIKSSTSLYCVENNVLNQSTSTFAGTRILQQQIVDSDIAANTISLSKLKNGTSNKYLKYNVSGVLTETDLPASVTDFSQLTGTLANNQVAAHELGIDKFQNYPLQPNKFIKTDANGVFQFADQSSTVAFGSITSWPEAYPSYNVVFADSTTGPVSYYNFNSANAIGDYGNAQKLIYTMNYINSDIQQQRYYNMNDLVTFLSAKALPGSKLEDNDLLSLSTAFYGKIANSWQSFRLNESLFSTLCNSQPVVNFARLVTSNEKSDGQVLSYSLADNALKWVDNGSSLSLAQGEIQIGSYLNNNSAVKLNLALNANILDNSYYFPNNLAIPQSMVLTTNLLSNTCNWSKIYANNLASTTPTAGQILRYALAGDGTFDYVDNNIFSLNWAQNVQSNGFKIKYTSSYKSVPTTANLANIPGFIPCDAAGTQIGGNEMKIFQSNYNIESVVIPNNPNPNNGMYSQWVNINDQGVAEQSTIFHNDFTMGVQTPCDSGFYQQWYDQDSNFTNGIRINQSGAISSFSDENLKMRVVEQQDADMLYCYDIVKNIKLKYFQYNIFEQEIEQHRQGLCSCQNKNSCRKKLSRMILKSAKKNYSFMYQDFQNKNLSCITNQFSQNYKQSYINEKKQILDQQQNQALDEKIQQKIDDEQQNKMIQKGEILTILYSAFQESQRKIAALEQRLANAGL